VDSVEAVPAAQPVAASPRHISARDFSGQQFAESLRLKGALGDFLGDLEREMLAITLTGAPGQGRTHFCMQLIRYFCQLKLQVVFWTLEEGLSKKMKRKLVLYRLDKQK
jgi:DNA replication protein DnaC